MKTKSIISKVFLLIACAIFSTSCCTIFTSTKQNITFVAPNGTKIYDAERNIKIAEVEDNNMVTARIKKRMEEKQLIAKKNGTAIPKNKWFSPVQFL